MISMDLAIASDGSACFGALAPLRHVAGELMMTFMAKTTGSNTLNALGRMALRHPGVEVGVACKGTAAESATYKVNGRAFLFVRPAAAMFKLGESAMEPARFAEKEPGRYVPSSSGWTTVKRPGDAPLPMDAMERWIAESYRLMAGRTKKKAAKAK